MMFKVLLVSYAFPPISSPGAQRVERFAHYLSIMGVDVTVLTCSNAYSSMVDKGSTLDRETQYKVIYTDDLIDKTSMSNDTKTQKAKPLRNLKHALKVTLKKVGNFFIFPDRDITWLPTALHRIKKLDSNYDFVIGSYPYATNLLLAYKASKILNCKLILDYRDLWTQDENQFKKSFFKQKIDKKLEEIITKQPSGILCVSEFNTIAMRNKLNNKTPVKTIYNGYESSYLKDIRLNDDVLTQEKFIITYAGSFYGGERNPKAFLTALYNLKKIGLIKQRNFCFNFIGNVEPFFSELVNKFALQDLISFKGFCSSSEVLSSLRRSNLQLVITRAQAISKGEMTTKVFEYLGVGRAILCLTKLDFEIADVLSKFDCATSLDVDNSYNIEKYIKEEIIGFRQMNNKVKSFNNGSHFTREDSTRNLLCFLQEL